MNNTKKRFNIIDVILILAIVAVVAGVIIRSGFADSFSEKMDEGNIEYEFIINSIKATSDQYFDEGTVIYSQTTQKEIGKILTVTTRPAEAYIELPTGEIVKTVIPDRIDVIGTAVIKGNEDNDGRCMLDGTTHIAAGKNIYARTDDITFMFTVEGAKFVPSSTKDVTENEAVTDIQQENPADESTSDITEAEINDDVTPEIPENTADTVENPEAAE